MESALLRIKIKDIPFSSSTPTFRHRINVQLSDVFRDWVHLRFSLRLPNLASLLGQSTLCHGRPLQRAIGVLDDLHRAHVERQLRLALKKRWLFLNQFNLQLHVYIEKRDQEHSHVSGTKEKHSKWIFDLFDSHSTTLVKKKKPSWWCIVWYRRICGLISLRCIDAWSRGSRKSRSLAVPQLNQALWFLDITRFWFYASTAWFLFFLSKVVQAGVLWFFSSDSQLKGENA